MSKITRLVDTFTYILHHSLTRSFNHLKNELNNLQEKDPEFYQFLKENDQELLDFGEDLDDLDDDIDGQEVIYHSLTQSLTHSLTHSPM